MAQWTYPLGPAGELDIQMDDRAFTRRLSRTRQKELPALRLHPGSRVGVIGGGPAGCFFSYFLLDLAERVGLKIHVDIYEPRDFDAPGPAGCNMCGGVIYESLVQSLAIEGINLPPSVVQRGIECNKLHLDVGSVQIWTRHHEKRIATTFRGLGPRGPVQFASRGLDRYLLDTAVAKGAQHIHDRVAEVGWLTDPAAAETAGRLVQIKTQTGLLQTYDLVAVAGGVNTAILEQFRALDFGYEPPRTTKLLVREYRLGKEAVSKYVGSAFHAFLLDIPGVDFGAIIPKGSYVTICLLSSHGNLDTAMMDTFMADPAVKRALPPDFSAAQPACHCGPRINSHGSAQPFGDRIVFIGDSGVSRLYKDGMGAAYRASKVAAATVVFHGISKRDFERHYLPFCRRMEFDNQLGRFLFKIAGAMRKTRFARRAILRMVSEEQRGEATDERGMSAVIWDMLTGGAPFAEVLKGASRPGFLLRLLRHMLASLLSAGGSQESTNEHRASMPQVVSEPQVNEVNTMSAGSLGRMYRDGEIIVRQGELGDCMYVVQDGTVEVLIESADQQIQLNVLGKDDFFGEMAIFDHEIRSATIRALGPARILTIDHRNFLQRIHEDPSLAYRLMQVMSERVRRLSGEVAQLRQTPVPTHGRSED
jgi:flavin-dependent dehydrogenase